jgi:hypothetical protein
MLSNLMPMKGLKLEKPLKILSSVFTGEWCGVTVMPAVESLFVLQTPVSRGNFE